MPLFLFRRYDEKFQRPPSASDCADGSRAVAAIGQPSLKTFAARNPREKQSGGFRSLGGVRDGPAHGLASERRRGLSALLLATGKVKVERAAGHPPAARMSV